jgi:hypothetical protein
MTIKPRKQTEEEIREAVERHSRIGKEMAKVCDGKSAEDVFYAALLFFSNNYAMHFGEACRARMIDLIHAQLHRDMCPRDPVPVTFFTGKELRDFGMRLVLDYECRPCMMPIEGGAKCGEPASVDCEWIENGSRVGVFVCQDCFKRFFLLGLQNRHKEGEVN